MTRKDFEWFAAWLDQYPNLLADYDALDDMMAYFEAINPAFKRGRFLLAAGFEREELDEIWDLEKDEY